MKLQKNKIPLLVFIGVSVFIFVFYLHYINLSTDTIILFLSSKLFYGEWLRKGIFPFFNPYIFNGVPYAFDLGMNHFHPLSLLFIFPFPLSFALWSAATGFLFLTGFYLLFSLFTNKRWFAIFLTFILFFSGSGFFLRMNNPTIFSVIAHYGLFLFSLSYLKKDGWKNYSFPLVVGILLTLSGHIQFVLYGYIIGSIVSIFYYKVSIKKIFLYFLFLGLTTSWYYLLSLPLVLESTRLTLRKDYVETGPIMPLQFLQLFFPFIWGYVKNGSKWNVGPTNVLLSSLLLTILFVVGILKKRIDKISLVLVGIFLLFSLGFVNFPFFRGPGQIFILIHIVILIAVARVSLTPDVLFHGLRKKHLLFAIILTFVFVIFFISPVFSSLFSKLYVILKHGKTSLFYDKSTIAVIGKLVGYSFLPIGLLIVSIFFSNTFKKFASIIFIIFIFVEGLLLNSLHNYFAPSNIFNNTNKYAFVDPVNYRMQTAWDVVPYVGFHTYMGNVLFRPPFSKEPPLIAAQEEKNFSELRKIFTTTPSSWSMVDGIQAIQGYSTFVPAKIAHYFDNPSTNYKEVYDYILKRNSLFAQSEKGSHINSIESSRITLYDPRWEQLGVRYFLSDRPLNEFHLIKQNGPVYLYESKKTLPIFRIESKDGYRKITPFYTDPNTFKFNVSKNDIGKNLVIAVNPNGFVGMENNKSVEITRQTFSMTMKIPAEGTITVSYSPIEHLIEKIKNEKK